MIIKIKTTGVHHVALRSSDMERSKRFYTETLGFEPALKTPELFLFLAGSAAFGVRAPDAQTPDGDKFNPFRVGLDYIALACDDEAGLDRAANALTKAGIEDMGVKTDATLGKRYVAFKDPDRMSRELHMI